MKHLFAIFILVLFSSRYAMADTYIYGSAGEAEFSSGGSPDMYEFGLGFILNGPLSLELSYVNLGAVGTDWGAGEFIDEEADGINAALVADLPLNEMLSIYLSAGMLRWDDTASYYLDGRRVDTETVKGRDWNFGAGFKAEVFDGLDLKFGFTEYDLDDIDVESISVGLVYSF